MSFFELHRHSDFWEKPEVFDPDRFAPENKKDFSNYYFPFGAGPRMCIGNNFAMYEMIMTVASVVKKYKLSSQSSEIVLNPMLTLKPSEALIKFDERQT